MSVVRHSTDRVCRHVDPETGVRCITRLCRFNPGTDCFTHSDAGVRRRIQAAQREFAAEHLMKQLGDGERIAA